MIKLETRKEVAERSYRERQVKCCGNCIHHLSKRMGKDKVEVKVCKLMEIVVSTFNGVCLVHEWK